MNYLYREAAVMKPDLKHRRFVEVPATHTWEHTLRHLVYSCPDTNESAWGATCLILKNNITGAHVPLEVTAVVSLAPVDSNQLDALAQPLRLRLQNYRSAVAAIPGILQPGVAHRFYFLSEEPWPDWLQKLTASASGTEWASILSVCAEPVRFFEWPQVGTLLWPGCTRPAEDGQHHFPPELTNRLTRLGLHLDARSNGPAIVAFLAAGGIRPNWGSEGWPIHHIYDGTGEVHDGPRNILHAVGSGQHFTHSAGLVAAHPVAHHLAHHSTLLKWLLRREAFLRFGYDPMGVF